MKRCVLSLLLLLTCLLAACGSTADPGEAIHTTELRAGTYTCSVDVQISGDLDPDDGSWLTFSVCNQGSGSLRLSLDRDADASVLLAPGETGAVTGTVGTFSKGYLCRAASVGGEPVAMTYTLTQSTVSPS